MTNNEYPYQALVAGYQDDDTRVTVVGESNDGAIVRFNARDKGRDIPRGTYHVVSWLYVLPLSERA